MPRPNLRDARSFLDLEAEVDRDEEEEEEDVGDLNDFIDDADSSADSRGPRYIDLQLLRRRWFGDDSGLDDVRDGGGEERESGDEPGATPPYDGARFPAEGRHYNTRDEVFESLTSDLPFEVSLQSVVTTDDYPLWRVPCRVGSEPDVVLSLLTLAVRPHYELRSAFTRSSIHGYIYVEATMNPSLVRLLSRTPGIRCGLQGLRYEGIPQEDWQALLAMYDSKATPVVGEWVLISRGKYKGDLALVSSFEGWQGVSVLLIPRIEYGHERPPPSKRKRSAHRPLPRLFDPSKIPEDVRSQPVKLTDDVYNYGSLRMENGLLRQSFNIHSISQGVLGMPTEVFATFHESKHPEILAAQYPCPPEFKFETNELVLILPTKTPGRITALRQCEAEVTPLNGEGDVRVSWANIQKYVVLGDYAEILSGMHKGHKGFVTAAQESTVTVTEFEKYPNSGVPRGKVNSNPVIEPEHCAAPRTMKVVVVHVNWVRVITPPALPHVPNAPLQIDEVPKEFPTPWINKYVIITQHKHAMRGSYAKVIDSIRPAKPTCQPHLVVQYERITPTGPRRGRFPYKDVVDAVSGRKLHADLPPEHPFYFNAFELQTNAPTLQDQQATPNISSTPAWSPSSIEVSLSPAWNPSAMTPSRIDSGGDTPNASTSTNLQDTPATVPTSATTPPMHPLLDPRLVGRMLRVSVSGGAHPKNETPVSIVRGQNDEVIIRQSWRNQSFGLRPEWVTARNPNPTRDNGSLVVIRGDHCGKYVRRIHHYYVNNDRDHPVMQLAVMLRVDGVEAITEDRIELPPEDLCQGFETEREKNLNANLMTSLREQARYPQQ